MDTLSFVIEESDLGLLLVAATARGVSHVRFGEERSALEAGLRRDLPYAQLEQGGEPARRFARRLVAAIAGAPDPLDLPLDVRGSRFQARVFEALRAIPRGATRSYGEVAREVGCPGGARAVARACATNPVPVVVPCHRVVPARGGTGGYLGGVWRKRALLMGEAAAVAAPPPAHDERALRVRTR